MTRAEIAHKNKLAGMGCMLCLHIHGTHDPAPVNLHHLRSGGWGRGDYTTLIPLCHDHHQGANGIHTLGTKAWERKYGVTQQDLLALTMERANL